MKTIFKKLITAIAMIASCIVITSCFNSSSNSNSAVGTYREHTSTDGSYYRTYELNANGSATITHPSGSIDHTYWERIDGGDVRIKYGRSWSYIDFSEGVIYDTYNMYRSHSGGTKYTKIK